MDVVVDVDMMMGGAWMDRGGEQGSRGGGGRDGEIKPDAKVVWISHM